MFVQRRTFFIYSIAPCYACAVFCSAQRCSLLCIALCYSAQAVFPSLNNRLQHSAAHRIRETLLKVAPLHKKEIGIFLYPNGCSRWICHICSRIDKHHFCAKKFLCKPHSGHSHPSTSGNNNVGAFHKHPEESLNTVGEKSPLSCRLEIDEEHMLLVLHESLCGSGLQRKPIAVVVVGDCTDSQLQFPQVSSCRAGKAYFRSLSF